MAPRLPPPPALVSKGLEVTEGHCALSTKKSPTMGVKQVLTCCVAPSLSNLCCSNKTTIYFTRKVEIFCFIQCEVQVLLK